MRVDVCEVGGVREVPVEEAGKECGLDGGGQEGGDDM